MQSKVTPPDIKWVVAHSLGWKYAHNGRAEGAMDCYGLVMWYAGKMGLELPDYQFAPAGYRGSYNQFLLEFCNYAEQVAIPRPGDVVVFNRKDQQAHMGIVIEGGRFLHASRGGVVIDHYYRQPWSHVPTTFYRLREVQ